MGVPSILWAKQLNHRVLIGILTRSNHKIHLLKSYGAPFGEELSASYLLTVMKDAIHTGPFLQSASSQVLQRSERRDFTVTSWTVDSVQSLEKLLKNCTGHAPFFSCGWHGVFAPWFSVHSVCAL